MNAITILKSPEMFAIRKIHLFLEFLFVIEEIIKMSMQCSVLCPDGHRVPIKMSRQTPLLTILEEACGKRKLDPAKHAIRRENDRPNVPNLDCSLTIGFAG